MKICAGEIYAKIVAAPIGERVSTRHTNGKYYNQSIEDMLTEQGYTNGREYERVFDWGTSVTYIKKLAAIRPYETPKHNMKIGDIIYDSWGWEQTNIDFYQVVAVTEKTVSLRKICAGVADYDAPTMSGHRTAVKDKFVSDEVIRKTPYLFSGAWRINFEYGAGGLWDGKPLVYSDYA